MLQSIFELPYPSPPLPCVHQTPETLKTAQKLGGDPFEDTPNYSTNQAFVFIKPHANTDSVKAVRVV